jgi:CO/xanthine dehydrogenase FAD-binding subunit
MDDLPEPNSDVHATADYRRRVARVLAERAILDARGEAAR